jgi:subtilisin family serine protease
VFRRCSIILLLLSFVFVIGPRNPLPQTPKPSQAISNFPFFSKGHETAPVKTPLPPGIPSALQTPATAFDAKTLPEIKSLTRLDTGYTLLPADRTNFRTFTDNSGITRTFRPGVILARFKSDPHPYALQVQDGTELETQRALLSFPNVDYAELDAVMERQFLPNDQQLSTQWHHSTIRSQVAWDVSLADSTVTVAMLDTPFQMDHPDLAPHAVNGWDMVSSNVVTTEVFRQQFANAGYVYHSTIGGGLACAAINNFIGVAGVANCQLMPLNIGESPTLTDMYKAILWAADHDVRIVNLSWDGAYSSVLNDGAGYLKDKSRGMVFMAGVNGIKYLNYPNQPNIYAISMTDQSDNPRSGYGPHIDFAAPGYEIYSTTTNSGFEVDSGSSYSCPLAAGMAAFVMSVNPALNPDQIFELMKSSLVDLGPAGWDQYFGWGRLDFGKLALATFATLPISRIQAQIQDSFTIQAQYMPGAQYELFRAPQLHPASWVKLDDFSVLTNEPSLIFKDHSPLPGQAFYQLRIRLP